MYDRSWPDLAKMTAKDVATYWDRRHRYDRNLEQAFETITFDDTLNLCRWHVTDAGVVATFPLLMRNIYKDGWRLPVTTTH